jgi:hypothetical protein
MKIKIALLATLFAFAGIASAQSSVTATYGVQSLVPSDTQNHIVNFAAKTAINNNFSVDAGIQTTVADVANTVTNRYEAGVTGVYSVASFATADIRGAIGQKAKSGSDSFTYYSVEPGINLALPAGFSARVAYRVRDALDNTKNADHSNTQRVSLGYALTKQDKVSIGYDRLRGDGANNTTYVAYTRGF